MIKPFIKIFLVLFAIYVLAMVTVYFLQRIFMYPIPAEGGGIETTSLTHIKVVEIKTRDGNTVPAWWSPPPVGAPVVMFFHGNGSSAYDGRFIYQHLIKQGYGVMGVEYPGYPNASGKPTQTSLTEAALAQYDFVRASGVEAEKIYLYGTSLGAGVAAQLAGQRAVGKIVMEAPFNSMVEMASLSMPLFAFPPLIKDKYKSHEALAGKTIPLLWIHGTLDRVIPLAQGQKLYDGYTGPKEELIITGGDHNDLWISGGREAITAFFAN